MLPVTPLPAVDLLRGATDAPALFGDRETITYGELRRRIDGLAEVLGTTRRLVMVEARSSVEAVAAYLAALCGGHPVLLVPAGDDEPSVRTRRALQERFDPDVVFSGGALRERRPGTAHELHPDLALLMSTSGSTGSPKLVRLSATNLVSNAAAIAEYLGLTSSDRAATTLPLHYCYGLSVLHSHLLVGAALVLSEDSVSDDGFWSRAAEGGITGFAGVPYTFDLLDAVGGASRLPHTVRYVTQAGGRLAPERVRGYAAAGETLGFDFFTMYGQTEATARMSYLPPRDAISGAGSIGRPVPGGAFRIDSPDDSGAGELVYSGDNVMMGYAESPEDLSRGRDIEELRTGDLARMRPDGYVEIVGRLNRFVKIYGLRIDLDGVQRELEAERIPARVAADGEELLVFVRDARSVTQAAAAVARRIGIPRRHVRVHLVDAFPVTSSGKPDNAALLAHHRAASQTQPAPGSDQGHGVTPERVRAVLALCTDTPQATVDDSFADLGGDSLSYVETSVRLEELLGPLPRDWPSRSPRDLAAPAAHEPTRSPARSRRTRALETPVLLRALAIVLIVGTHADLFLADGFSLKGGAHLLLVVAGYNLVRFALAPQGSRPRRLLGVAAQVAVPAVLWISAVALLSGKYAPATALLLNNTVPSDGRWNEQWQFWFLEAFVWTAIALAVAFGIRAVDRLERGAPWAFALSVLAGAVTLRFALIGVEAHHVERYALPTVLWCLALGWAIARADTGPRRVVVSIASALLIAGFFGEPLREGIVLAGVLALIWIPSVRVPAVIHPALTLIASASFFVYLTHWVVYPPFEAGAPLAGTVLSFVVGIAAWAVHRWVAASARRLAGARRESAQRPSGA
ncbi:AMP-binding protein [Microbacterium hydrocarbonoxydans]|uniref:AMP-binding protein n=1 Tax=Microbacterium hydrocarbonoxydans TaxID=273678 RepID=UPI0007BBCF8B|nr:AMP-binding protein [Microbacterium hydrocarbonoxydans]GAT72905.1 hypothetical protein MHM582_1383 [Microbacterium sp. HM58-2]